jgi:beta-glucanase (GH16 family)
MENPLQLPIAHHGLPQTSGHPTSERGLSPSGPQQPIGQPYWSAVFNPLDSVSVTFTHQIGRGPNNDGWGNQELEYYTTDANNSFYRGDNKLVIRAVANSNHPYKYTSARLVSQRPLGRQRGWLAVVLTPPCASGVWPAFWMLPTEPINWPAGGEVDIFESWNGDLVNRSSMHWGYFTEADANKHRTVVKSMPDMARPEGNMYGFAWDQPDDGQGGRAMWYINGMPIMKVSIPDTIKPLCQFQIIINVAMGGNVVNATPVDGIYELVVHSLELYDAPPGGWGQFENDWNMAPDGHS